MSRHKRLSPVRRVEKITLAPNRVVPQKEKAHLTAVSSRRGAPEIGFRFSNPVCARCCQAVEGGSSTDSAGRPAEQGIRHCRVCCALEASDWAAAKKPLAQYLSDEGHAVSLYSRALLDFVYRGDQPEARAVVARSLFRQQACC